MQKQRLTVQTKHLKMLSTINHLPSGNTKRKRRYACRGASSPVTVARYDDSSVESNSDSNEHIAKKRMVQKIVNWNNSLMVRGKRCSVVLYDFLSAPLSQKFQTSTKNCFNSALLASFIRSPTFIEDITGLEQTTTITNGHEHPPRSKDINIVSAAEQEAVAGLLEFFRKSQN